MKEQKKHTFRLYRGFTLVELILVVLILSIAAVVAVPMFSSAADIQVRATANRIAADLDYARGLAITRQKDYSVVFDAANELYEIQDVDGVPITNPLDNKTFTVNLANDARTGGVNIVSADFDGQTAVTFDYLGTPYAAGAPLTPQGVISLRSRDGSFTLTVKVEPVTGYVMIE
jgi:prepilin-type N-terminal cleavage/methylation domain-containing protein